MKQQLYSHEWVKISEELKYYLRDRFKIGKSTGSTVINNELVCDGTTDSDLKAMSLGWVIDILGEKLPWFKEELYTELFNMIVDEYYEEQEEKEKLSKEEKKNKKSKLEPAPITRWHLT